MDSIHHPNRNMKKLFAVIVVALISAGVAFAHGPAVHASKEGLFGLKPEYIHVLLNPLLGYQNMESIGSRSRVEMEKEMFSAGGHSQRKEIRL